MKAHPDRAKAIAARRNAKVRARMKVDPEYAERIRESSKIRGKESSRRWRERHPERPAEVARRWKRAHPGAASANTRKYNYGIEPHRYELLLQAQGGVCAICGRPETAVIRGTIASMSVDHDHGCCPGKKSCGKCIRGLLCRRCNGALGLFRDDPRLLSAALTYLEKKQA